MIDVTLQDLAAIRRGLAALPDLAHHVAGTPVAPDQIFFPHSHAAALDPDVALVVGNRGVGKSFWASALAGDESRAAIADAYRGYRNQQRLDGLRVRFGFSGAEGGGDALISGANISRVGIKTPAVLPWRAAVVRSLAPIVGQAIPARFNELINWIKDNPDEQQTLFRDADRLLTQRRERALILFDQLEQMADDWSRINELTKGLLQTALAMKSYKSIRLKIFMRPDQFENADLFRFPDGSKIQGEAVRLWWRATDLYALLYFELLRNALSRGPMRAISGRFGIVLGADSAVRLSQDLVTSAQQQRRVFEIIAGEFMGKGKNRGAPYTWIPLHLSDSRGEVSPRSFLRVLKAAADYEPAPSDSAIGFKGINDGVRTTSEHRLSELQEDYPWVSQALEPLRGALVPALKDDVFDRWRSGEVVSKIVSQYKGIRAPIDLVVAMLSSEDERMTALLNALQDIGVMDVRKNGKIDVPDIFRVRAGILRKGGVPPQQRPQ
ncbi:hypothetical protein [uncultured Thiodictyon sp.]|jgi:hypothetical protein|uniref:hypothetical protein n=1 Tax=uncultured Thiodictyon sp. TaxID=1846217 RepID=UPI0025E6B868|nr:hypothetical protein [uncultured Thiodictyon sp.]